MKTANLLHSLISGHMHVITNSQSMAVDAGLWSAFPHVCSLVGLAGCFVFSVTNPLQMEPDVFSIALVTCVGGFPHVILQVWMLDQKSVKHYKSTTNYQKYCTTMSQMLNLTI